MTHRERVLAVFNRQVPDRVPRSIGLVPAAAERLAARIGQANYWSYWDLDLAYVGLSAPVVDWQARFGRYYDASDAPFTFESGEYPPEWGVATRPSGMYHFGRPLFPLQRATTVREIEEFPFPDYLGEWGHNHLEAEVTARKQDGYPVLAFVQRLFQNAWYLRSREQLFVDMVESPAIAEALFSRIGDILTQLAVRFAQAGVDVLFFPDDIGMQDRMMISPANLSSPMDVGK